MKGETLGIRLTREQKEKLAGKKNSERNEGSSLSSWALDVLLDYSNGKLLRIGNKQQDIIRRILGDEFFEFWGLDKDGRRGRE